MKTNNTLLKTLLIAVMIPVVAIAAFFFTKGNYKVLETSLLTVLQNIAEENAPEPPDLGIDSVTVRKVSDPSDDFRFYKYKATIILRNTGGNLVDGRVLIHAGENQRHAIVRNTEEGFTLLRDDVYIVRDFEFLFDGKYNGGEMPISVEITDKFDYYEDNNSHTIEIYEPEAKIDSTTIDEVLEDNVVVLDFNTIPFSIRKHEFEICASYTGDHERGDLVYDEVYSLEKVLGYFTAKNTEENIQEEYDCKEVTELNSHFIDLAESPFDSESPVYTYVKATNPSNGYFAISDLVVLPVQKYLTRGEFAKAFVKLADVDISEDGVSYFEDVEIDDEYYAYIQSLYNLGLIDIATSEYEPDSLMSRAESLKIVLDYYDVDLEIGNGAPHFEDVAEDHLYFPYIESLVADSKGLVFDDYFNPKDPATENYLNYLINEYSESN